MNSEYEKRLAAEIDRELKALPELPAPVTLAARVMANIERRARAPWYQQSWQEWPFPVQALSLLLLLTAFGGLCFVGWNLPQMASATAVLHKLAALASGVATFWNVLSSLFAALVLAVQHLGTGFLVGCLLAVALAWIMCLGLGTACVRLALIRR